MWDHPARLDTAPDAVGRVCGVCGDPVHGLDGHLRHAGETRRPRVLPAREDVAAWRRAERLAERALTCAPHDATGREQARMVVEALYADGLICRRPRVVRPRRVRAA